MTGGGRGGQTLGETGKLGFNNAQDRVHMHDLQAKILHWLGLDHTRPAFRFQGRDCRLTDAVGEVLRRRLA